MYMVTNNEGTGCPIMRWTAPRCWLATLGHHAALHHPDYPTIGFQATTPIAFDGGSAPPPGPGDAHAHGR